MHFPRKIQKRDFTSPSQAKTCFRAEQGANPQVVGIFPSGKMKTTEDSSDAFSAEKSGDRI